MLGVVNMRQLLFKSKFHRYFLIIGKDNDKSKTILGGSSLRALASGIAAAKSSTSGSATSVKGSQDSQNWMRWDAERSNR